MTMSYHTLGWIVTWPGDEFVSWSGDEVIRLRIGGRRTIRVLIFLATHTNLGTRADGTEAPYALRWPQRTRRQEKSALCAVVAAVKHT